MLRYRLADEQWNLISDLFESAKHIMIEISLNALLGG